MEDKKSFPWQSLNLALSLAAVVAISVGLAALLGRWLDTRLGTAPWLFLISTLLAFVFANIYIVVKALKLMKQIDEEAERKKR
jgi:F0F1-type ATP synthase assembly protein I